MLQSRFVANVSGPGSLRSSGYWGNTGVGSVVPRTSAGLGPVEPEFIRRLCMSTSMRNLVGAGLAMSSYSSDWGNSLEVRDAVTGQKMRWIDLLWSLAELGVMGYNQAGN